MKRLFWSIAPSLPFLILPTIYTVDAFIKGNIITGSIYTLLLILILVFGYYVNKAFR